MARRRERAPGVALVLGVHVDRGEHAVPGHPAQQPQPADAGPGADLHHGPCSDGRGEEAQAGAGAAADRGGAELDGRGPRAESTSSSAT